MIPVSNYIQERRGPGKPLEHWGVAFATILVALLYLKATDSIERISAQLAGTPFNWYFFVAHLAAVGVLIGLASLPMGTHPEAGIKAARILVSLLAVALAVFAFLPVTLCRELLRSTWSLWILAIGAGGVAAVLVDLSWLLWESATYVTLVVVQAMLRLVSSSVVADLSNATIGIGGFTVVVGSPCSGLEGVALMLLFSVGWLIFFRRECRFPQALVLVPAGLAIIWLLNALRIATLILIGAAGAPKVAVGGFHSQAGWIAFNAVAVAFCLCAQRVPWVRAGGQSRPQSKVQNSTFPYLMPFLMVLAASMISRAAAGGFEWLYPLRFFAGAATLWIFRARYRGMGWRFGWEAPAAGGLVFVLWLAMDRWAGTGMDNGIVSGLASWPESARIGWLVLRTVGAVITVPIAEELAFRGFLIRRVISRDFDELSPRSYTFLSVLVSSVAFGLLHGNRWLAGTVAGLIYAAIFLRRGRMGDAVAAHAATNALLAGWVLIRGAWYLW